MWVLVHPSHSRLCWWVKGRPLYFEPISWVPLQKKMYYILLLVYKWDECQHLLLFIEFGKMSKTSLQNLQDSKPHNLCIFKKRPDAEFIVFLHTFSEHI
jgi:hypothetical protein